MSNAEKHSTEVLFYQLDRQPLDAVLPVLLEKTLERGWRAVVQTGSDERLEALDTKLWTYRDDSFLPHGTKADRYAEQQPVYITTDDENPNDAGVRFLVDGAVTSNYGDYIRVVYLFDGRDKGAVADARQAWRSVLDAGCTATYWRQNETGAWQKQA